MSKIHFPALALLLLCGCAGGARLGANSSAVQVAETLGPPDSPVVSIDTANYRIGPTDEIAVSVFGAPELDREGAVDAAGNFSLPLAGSIAAAGRTPLELATDIEGRLRGRYLREPKVAVNIKVAKAQMVTVDGEVRQPGLYPVVGRMSLQQVLATAKGASEAADIGNVVVFRTVNGQKMAAMFNVKDIRAGRYSDPQIYGNDIVVVGQSAMRRFLRDAAMTFPLLGRFIPVL